MAREHENDVPGDIAGSDAENLPGGFGVDNPDLSPDATVDELVDNDVAPGFGRGFQPEDQQGGITSGTGYTDAANTGSTVEMNELIEGEEEHPGAAVGFTGEEDDKQIPPGTVSSPLPRREAASGAGGKPSEPETFQQQENFSVESEGPVGGQGAAGENRPDDGGKAD